MSLFKKEVEANFDAFTTKWKQDLPTSISTLDAHRDEFLKSYGRIASLNAWRGSILEGRLSAESLGFFAEAMNDAVTSHVMARCGNWRLALMSLRSCVENTCYCMFYKDHAVELRLWETGKHRPGFSETLTYLKNHPDVAPFANNIVSGIASVEAEYSTLSRAVHASAKGFRMSVADQQATLWRPDAISLSQWKTREGHTLSGLNLLLLTMYRDALHGAQQMSLRRALSMVVPPALAAKVKADLKVTIIAS